MTAQSKDIIPICYPVSYISLCGYDTMGGKNKFWLGDIKERQFSVMLHWLLFKIAFTVLYAQFCMSQKRICCLVVSLYVVGALHNLLWLVFDFFE